MGNRNFTDIKEIYETSDGGEVNFFLSREWKLLEIYNKNTGNLQLSQTIPVYIMGRPEAVMISSSDVKNEIEKDLKERFENY